MGGSKYQIIESCAGVSILAEATGAGPFGRTRPAGTDERRTALAAHWDSVAATPSSQATRSPGAPMLSLVAAMAHIADVQPEAPLASPPIATSGLEEASVIENDGRLTRGQRVHPAPQVSIIIPTLDRIDLLQACLDSIDMHVAGRVAHETIVVANGTALDVLHPIQHRDDVVLLRSRVNRGFAGACNWAVEHARGDYLVFLSDNTEITPRWLQYLVATASREGVGAVGSRVLQPDRSVLEVGSVLRIDGSAHAVGRDLPSSSRAHNAVRDVDFAAGGGLLVKRVAWDEVGGMDERYFPAYYAYLDLCLKLHDGGFRVMVDPRSLVRHFESASGDHEYREFRRQRDHATFLSKWGDLLGGYSSAEDADVDRAVRESLHRASGRRPRLLIVDDRPPDQALGSGFGRMLVAVTELSAEYEITLLPTTGGDSSVVSRLAELGVDVVWERVDEHLQRWPGWYDAVLVSRPHNFQQCQDLVRRLHPQAALLYDAEGLWHLRLQRQATFTHSEEIARDLLQQAAEMEAMERSAVAGADHVISLSTDEAAAVRSWTAVEKVTLIPPWDAGAPDVGGGFSTRRDALLTAAWLAGPGSPNIDALRFFVHDVLPHVSRRVPSFRLVVTGGAPSPEVMELERPQVVVVGHVPDLSAAFARARVVVVPTRYGSGVKIKTIEALQHGVPVVATSVGAEGIAFGDLECVAVHDDPLEFAAAVAGLLTDEDRWQRARDAALRFSRRPHAETRPWSAALGRAIAARTAHPGS